MNTGGDRPPAPIRIALCAGETSGDQLGAGLIAELRKRYPDAQFAGIGGPLMREAGLDAWHDAQALAVMGLGEVLAHLPRLLRLRKGFRQRVLDWQPDVFIGIDAPDFNLGVDRWLKQRGVRTVHYVSPSVWAWRESRAKKIGQSADRVLCLFPMEPPIYANHGVGAVFVGHPLADDIPLQPDRQAARERLGLPRDTPVLAVLPGSRLGEIERMWPVFNATARLLAEQVSGLHVVVPVANEACQQRIRELSARENAGATPITFFPREQAQALMIASDAVLLASGTAALEAMLCKRPMVIGHRIAASTYAIVKGLGLLKSRWVSLPNVLAGEEVVPELLQDRCTPENLTTALLPLFQDPAHAEQLQARFEGIHRQLRQDASARAADAIVGLLQAQA